MKPVSMFVCMIMTASYTITYIHTCTVHVSPVQCTCGGFPRVLSRVDTQSRAQRTRPGITVCRIGIRVCRIGISVCRIGISVCRIGITVCRIGIRVCRIGISVAIGYIVWNQGI